MLQPELLLIFSSHKEIPEIAGILYIQQAVFYWPWTIFPIQLVYVHFFPLNSFVFSCNFLSQPSDASSSYPTSVELQQPTLSLLNSLLSSVTTALERAAEEKSVLLNKVQMQKSLSLYLLHLILSTWLPF